MARKRIQINMDDQQSIRVKKKKPDTAHSSTKGGKRTWIVRLGLVTGLLGLVLVAWFLFRKLSSAEGDAYSAPQHETAQAIPDDTVHVKQRAGRFLALPEGLEAGSEGIFDGSQSLRMLLSTKFDKALLWPLLNLEKGSRLLESPQAGNRYIWLQDTSGNLTGLAAELNPFEYVLVQPGERDKLHFFEREKYVKPRHLKLYNGPALYQSLADSVRSSYRLLEQLNEAFAWTVDLFHLAPDTRLEMVFDELWTAERRIGIERLQRVNIIPKTGQSLAAVYFDEPGYEGYYDSDGYPMKRGFLAAPVSYTRVSSPFGLRKHPILGELQHHFGTDFAAAEGADIVAVADGFVEKTGSDNKNGNYVKLNHGKGIVTWYLHMQSRPPVRKGQRVKQSQLIGHVGQTGSATGPHVCYRMKKDGKPVDPASIELPKGTRLERGLRRKLRRKIRLYQ
jgi:murein DD-endopeptidase MepM/ murein hydrolase activator NlpD